MLTYSEYYHLVELGFNALKEKLEEAIEYTHEQYSKALEREKDQEKKDLDKASQNTEQPTSTKDADSNSSKEVRE